LNAVRHQIDSEAQLFKIDETRAKCRLHELDVVQPTRSDERRRDAGGSIKTPRIA